MNELRLPLIQGRKSVFRDYRRLSWRFRIWLLTVTINLCAFIKILGDREISYEDWKQDDREGDRTIGGIA